MHNIEIGQYWVENKKDRRIVEIVDIRDEVVRIRTIITDTGQSGYTTWALSCRFNGKPGGYTCLGIRSGQ